MAHQFNQDAPPPRFTTGREPRAPRRENGARPAAALGLALGLLAPRAGAQTATALDRFEPAPASDSLLAVPSPEVKGNLEPSAGVVLSYARAPLVLLSGSGDESTKIGDIVSHQLVLHTLLDLQLERRLKLEVDVPFTLSQGGESPLAGSMPVPSPSGAAINDIRGGVRVEVLRQDGAIPSAAIAFTAWFPSGDDEAYTGTGSLRFAPAVVIGGAYRHLVWSATGSRRFQTGGRETGRAPALSARAPDGGDAGGLLASDVLFGAGIAARFGPLQVGPEVFGSTVADSGVSAFSRETTSVEIMLGARYERGSFSARAAGGVGIAGGIGEPAYRLIASLAYAIPDLSPSPHGPAPADGQPDRSGGAGSASASRGAGAAKVRVSTVDPRSDRDGDLVPDEEDACPTLPGESGEPGSPSAAPGAGGASAVKTRRGCPPDADGDAIADADDRCPTVPGVEGTDPARTGCPADSDGDSIPDPEDRCPLEKGEKTNDAKTHGCPTSVRLAGTQIVILQQVTFATGRDEISSDSFALLAQVAQVMKEHPEIARLAVDGHTDNDGSVKRNTALSQQRALAVVRWLNEHGVDARRTEARGFGPRQPLGDNGTDEGRARNRRVEFQILRRTELGEAGWKDGPLD
jgi:outer membrane protein OmpA-like peptidoglycan-associated protein